MARTLIVEADGASRGNPGPASYGALVVDAATGEVLVELAEGLGVVTNNVAEYRGLIAGLRAAYAIDPEAEVEVRMDSKLAVQQMSGEWKIKHPDIRPLALEAAAAFPVAGRVRYTWVPREQNKRADALGNLALDDPAAAAAKMAESAAMVEVYRRARAGDGAAIDRPSSTSTADPGELADAERAAEQPSRASTQSAALGEPADAESAADQANRAEVADAEPAADRPSTESRGWSAPDLGPPTTLILLRHGATPLTAEKRFSGLGDPDLAETGRAQVAAVARRLAARGGIDAIVSSPLRRTRQTAQAVADALGLEVHIDDEFREADFGAWDGHTFAEIRDRWPDELTAWLASTAVAPPGGESFDAVAKRIRAAKDALLERFPRRTILVVTHVTPIKTLVREALGAPPESLYAMDLSAASLSVVTYYSDGRGSLRLFNDTAHLNG